MTAGTGARTDRLADRRSLRRIERFGFAWAAVGAIACGVATGWRAAVVLTAAALVSIVAFRGLQRIVSALGPSENQPAGRSEITDPREGTEPPEPSGPDDQRPKIGALGIGIFVRLVLLTAIVAAGAFLLEPEHFPAIVLGFSTLPAALMTEGLRQAVRAFRGRGREDHDGS